MISALFTMGGLGVVAGLGLGVVSRIFAVEVDPQEEAIGELLPGANCGACGYAGCSGFASSIVKGEAQVGACPVCDSTTVTQIASIMGVEVVEDPLGPKAAHVLCGGGCSKAVEKFEYDGIEDCTAAIILSGGSKGCVFGCLGLGSCEKICPFGAIMMNDEKLPVVDTEKCTGCMICVNTCPKNILGMVPVSASVIFSCNSKDKGKDVKSVCSVGCISCGKCEKICPYNAVKITGGLVENDFSKCVHCGLCVVNCPTHSITMEGRPRVAYIEETCIGCGACLKACPVNAITGSIKQLHVVTPEPCIGCGICERVCPKKCVDMQPTVKDLENITQA